MKTTIRIYTALVFIFLYLPIAVMVLYSFNSINSTGVFGGFSLRWYRELFRDTETLTALRNTLILAVICLLYTSPRKPKHHRLLTCDCAPLLGRHRRGALVDVFIHEPYSKLI